MGLSSNSLIHFTKTLTNLESILKDNFKVLYCHEIICSKKEIHTFVPMVSFCDIPFSQIKKHIKSYGNYGIGLKKEWAKKNRLNPVLYFDQNSSLGEHLIEIFLESSNKTFKDGEYPIDIFNYLKNYEGDLYRKGKLLKNYRFSDEREWRYVLNVSESLMYTKLRNNQDKNIENDILKKNLNNRISKERLSFEPNDIQYIIIKSEKERDKIIKILEKSKTNYPTDQLKILSSKIISTEQINYDF